MRRSRLSAVMLGVLVGTAQLGLAGCGGAASRARRPVPVAPREAPPSPSAPLGRPVDATGVWDWISRSTTQQGDLQIEQEEWHLDQQGSNLQGYYQRQVVTMSADQRPFQCNGMLGFIKNIRARVLGEVHNGKVTLREVGVDTEHNPCDSGQRDLLSYVGNLQGEEMLLQYNTGGEQRLVRRATGSSSLSLGSSEPTRSGSTGGGGELGQRTASAPTIEPVDGLWEWQFRAVDADGDLHVEREQWHLSEKNAEIGGYYERTIERQRTTGVFSCNGTPHIQFTTRFTVKGQRFGDKVAISEIDYQLQPNPCETGQRRLDSYQGTLLPEGQLMLSWSGGHQILRRKR